MTAPPLAPDLRRYRTSTTLSTRGATETQGLPTGVCGQVEGIAMVYDIIDSRGTTFARGCLDRTIRERVAAGKVKLYVDHGDVLLNQGMYDTHLHIGVVRSMWDAQEPSGQWVCRFRADIFATEQGRKEHEYLSAVAATGSETGVSIGMLDGWKYRNATVDGIRCEQITEVPLREISITGESAIPGTRVTSVRAELQEEPEAAAKEETPAEPVAETPKEEAVAEVVADVPAADPPAPAEPVTTESIVTHGGLRFRVTTVTGAGTSVHVEPLDAPAPLVTEPINYFALLDGIVAHLGHAAVRAHVGATVRGEEQEDRDAGSGAPASPDTNASLSSVSGVSQGGTEPLLPNVGMEERLAFARSQLLRLYPP